MGSTRGSCTAKASGRKVILITGTPPLGDKEMVLCLLAEAMSSALGILSSLGDEENLILWICCGWGEGTIMKARLLKHIGFFRRKIKSSEAMIQNEAEVGIGGGESLRLQRGLQLRTHHGNIPDTGQQERGELLGSLPEHRECWPPTFPSQADMSIRDRGTKHRTTAQTHHLLLDPCPPLCSPVESSF